MTCNRMAIQKSTVKLALAVTSIVASALLPGTAFMMTAKANATPAQDAQFLYAVGEGGMVYGNAAIAIGQGRALCIDMDNGYTPGQAVGLSMTYYGLDYNNSVWLTATSILVYCPWNAPSTPMVKV